MTVVAPQTLVESLAELSALTPRQLAEVRNTLCLRCADAAALAGELVGRGWLTAYQAEALLAGRGGELRLGPYLVLERLGEGGMGQVFKARHTRLDRLVALKLIRPERLARPDAVPRFRREIRAAAQLAHPNIVRAYDADEAGGVHFYSMEYVEGTDLSRYVRAHGPLPAALACALTRQAALGLQHAFERGLIHRDIKPANLLVQGAGPAAAEGGRLHDVCLKIADFGLARPEEAERDESMVVSREGLVIGTPDYMAPEQALDSRAADVRSDLYSLGCTLYFLLAGRPPFAGCSAGEKLLRHQTHAPPPLPAVPAAVADVVERLLAKDPAARFQTPAELAAELDRVVAALPESGAAAADTVADLAVPGGETVTWTRAVWARVGPLIVLPGRAAGSRRGGRRIAAVVLLAVLAAGAALAGWLGDWWSPPAPPEEIVVRKSHRRPAPPPVPPAPAPSEPVAVTDAWVRATAALSLKLQGPAVRDKLAELNPGFDVRNWQAVVDGDAVDQVRFNGTNVTDLSPLKALTRLTDLYCPTSEEGAIVSIADLSPIAGLPLQFLTVHGHRVRDLTPLRGMKTLRYLGLGHTRVSDLTPLEGLPLENVVLYRTFVRDLSPLRGAPLSYLRLEHTPVEDLSPIAGAKLRHLDITGTRVRDLSPVRGAPLEALHCGFSRVESLEPLRGSDPRVIDCRHTPVASLAPLAGTKGLFQLDCFATAVTDLTPLGSLPRLEVVRCDFDPARDRAVLRGLKLKKINYEDPESFWRRHDRDPKVVDDLVRDVAALPPEQQAERVVAKLKEFNPGLEKAEFSWKVDPARAVVTWLQLGNATPLTDLSPVRALPELEELLLFCYGPPGGENGPLVDISPVRDLRKLRVFFCNGTHVYDLRPLAGLALTNLRLHFGGLVEDLSPLRGMQLRELVASGTHVVDLRPLAGMPFTAFGQSGPPSGDLSPLRDLRLTQVGGLRFDYFRHAEVLRAIATLKEIERQPVETFWAEQARLQVEFVRRELRRRNAPAAVRVGDDFTHERGVVRTLTIGGAGLDDLTPLQELPGLTELTLEYRPGPHAAVLRSLAALRTINGKPAAEVLR